MRLGLTFDEKVFFLILFVAACRLLLVNFLLGLFFEHEHGSDMFFQNIC
jgi:hypothetical protein